MHVTINNYGLKMFFGIKFVFTLKSIFLYKFIEPMKKITVIFLITFVTAILVSSCNKKECPAYTKVNTEQTGKVS
jgi:hypothetical protein